MQEHSPETAVYELPAGQRITARVGGCSLTILAPILLMASLALAVTAGRGILSGLHLMPGPGGLAWLLAMAVVLCLALVVIVLAVLLLVLGIGAAVGAGRMRLVISPEGIEYHQIPGRIVTPWANVKRIGWSPYNRGATEGIVLNEPAVWEPSRFWPRLGSRLRQSNLLRFIPLTPFDPWWQEGPIGRDIQRYAPHLFH